MLWLVPLLMPEADNPDQAEKNENQPAEPATAELSAEKPVPKETRMEIHPIHGSVLTLREFFVHLSIITLGILIALSLEGLLEWQHHRSLVREARENLAKEISHNQQSVEKNRAAIRQSEEQLNKIIKTMQKLEKDQKLPENEQLTYSFSFDTPYFTSWNTANRSGAIQYMNYDEVEKYTETYDQQQDLVDLSHQALLPLAQLSALNVMFGKGLKKISDKDLEDIQRIAYQALLIDQALEGTAKELGHDYAKFASSER